NIRGIVMTFDGSGTVEIRGSPIKLIGLVGLGALATAGAASLAFRWLPGIGAGSFAEFIGYCGLLFFGLCTAMAFWRLLKANQTVVTITPRGIKDVRVAAEIIPWSAVRNISTWEIRRQKIMVLDIDPATEQRLTLTRIARWSRGPNRALGADGLCVTPQGLKID